MTKEKTYIFYGCSGDEAKDWSTLTRSDGSQSRHRLLAQHHDCRPNAEAPEEGYRLSEYKHDPQAYSTPLTERQAAGSTHYRPGPWIVTRVESYLPDLPVGTEYTEVVMCWCDYQPLPEAENPWVEMIIRNEVTFEDSFGGHKDLFGQFLESDTVRDYKIVGPVPSEFKEKVEALKSVGV